MQIKTIKIVGQPMYNIGDLAAFKSLNILLQNKFDAKIKYSIFANRKWDIEFQKDKTITLLNDIPIVSKYEKMLVILSPNALKLITYVFPSFKKKYKCFIDSDFFLFAPGGLELGLYKEWDYLWIMASLNAFKKEYGIYSRSIGDFQNETFLDNLFKRKVIKYLKKSKFNGLRDLKSQKEAIANNIYFNPSIDVVFSNIPDYKGITKITYLEQLKNNYVVFTPSAFDWHPRFSLYPSTKFIELYLKILNTLLKESDLHIVMLPHIYKDNLDVEYFKLLKSKTKKSNRIFILENNYNSDLYQYVISKSKFAIVSRLHQTIFAINNHTPFLSISYEHKIEDMMKIIGLEKNTVRLRDILDNKLNIQEIINSLLNDEYDVNILVEAQNKANQIALNSFEELSNTLLEIY